MTSATDLPQELCYDPLSFVVLTGLDIKYNAIHKSIWDAFSNNRRTDRVPISFGCLPGDHVYPRCKDKRSSYEWYIPKGILKTRWMDKHLHQVPAVVVIFYELDWDEPAWKEKQLECASRVEVVRTSLQGRGTKIAVVLIQKSTPLPPGEDMVAAERAAALCSACDLSAKSLFVLPHTDHLLGYIIRLENAFYELGNSYYHTEARRVKAHKEFLNKTTHQLLFPRHQFKIAFFNELMQDPSTASKHYRQAYSHIHELRSHDTNNLEVKVLGGFINYKLCRLCFLRLNTPLEAISQFRRHIDLFKPKSGNPELLFEHSAWMSKQFTVFGDLFDEAIKAGLAAIQTQHPGFYYQQAAYYAQERRVQARRLCAVVTDQEYPANDPLDTGGSGLDFYGQRPWRQGHQSIDPPDSQKEKEGILALKHQEATIDHSWLIIPLLSNAVAQFKKYKCPRMKRFLTVQMGGEYYHAQDYSKAATLLSHTAWDYRSNRWWDVLNRILVLTLRCAYLVANVQQYISVSFELLGRHTRIDDEEKTRIQMNLIRVISGKTPDPEPLTTLEKTDEAWSESDHIEALESAKHLWLKALSEPKMYGVELNNLVPFIECKTMFASERFTANEPVILHVFLKTSCPFPIRFSRLSISFESQNYNKHCVLVDSTLWQQNKDSLYDVGDLYFEPKKFKKITFSFPPDASDVGKSIQIASVTLSLGGEGGGNCAMLKWNGTCHDAVTSQETAPLNQSLKTDDTSIKNWRDIVPNHSCEIKQRPPLIKVEVLHSAPLLLNEVYRVQIIVSSQEKETAENVTAIVRLEPNQQEDIFRSTFMALTPNAVFSSPATKALEINFNDMAPGATVSKDLFVHATKSGTRRISTRVSYSIADKIKMEKVPSVSHDTCCICTREVSISFNAVPAFQMISELVTMNFEVVKFIQPDNMFVVMVHIQCCSPWPIEIKGGSVSVGSDTVEAMDGTESQALCDVRLEEGEKASDAICLLCKEDGSNQNKVNLGKYKLLWRRCEQGDDNKFTGSSSLPFVSTTIDLLEANVRKYPLKLSVKIPPSGEIGKQLALSYVLLNNSDEPRELEIACDVAENFMFSGIKLQRVRILPGCDLALTYGLFPLAPGFQSLPRLHIKEVPSPGTETSGEQGFVNDVMSCSYLKEVIPSSIFVKPSGKQAVKSI